MNHKLHILLIDNDYQWIEELRKIFALEPSIKIVGTADNLNDGLQKLQMLKPDIVFLNIELGDVQNFVQQARKSHPATIFIAQLNQNDQKWHQLAQTIGIHKVLLKNAVTTGEMIQIVRQVWDQAAFMKGPAQPQLENQTFANNQQPNLSAPMNNNPFQGFGQSPQYQTPPSYGQPAYTNPPYNSQPPSYSQSPYWQSPRSWPDPSAQGDQPFSGNRPIYGNVSGPSQTPQMQPKEPFAYFDSGSGSGSFNPYGAFSHPRIRTMVIAVNSSKGGVGKSTISKELAAAFAIAKLPSAPGMPADRLKVCLVDMDLDYGNISTMLGLSRIPNIANWAADIHERLNRGEDKRRLLYTPQQFEPFLLTHPETGLRVLASPVLPTEALDVSEQVVEIIIDSLKNYFDVVILDSGNNTKDYTLISLDKAQKVIIVTTPDVAAVKNVQSLLETLKAIQYPMDKLNLVVNEVSRRDKIGVDDVVKSLDLPLLGVIPEEPKVRDANNNAQIMVLGRDTEYTNAIRKIGHQLVPVFSTRRKQAGSNRPSLFGFFKKK